MITFKANLISQANINKLTPQNSYKQTTASIVELDKASKADLRALKNVNSDWGKGNSYANDIVQCFNSYFDNSTSPKDDVHIFAVTTQKDSFERLDSKKILGLSEITNESEFYVLDYLQTNPRYKSNSATPKFKGVGSAIVNFIKDYVEKKEILLMPAENAVGFYQKHGFKFAKSSFFMTFKK